MKSQVSRAVLGLITFASILIPYLWIIALFQKRFLGFFG